MAQILRAVKVKSEEASLKCDEILPPSPPLPLSPLSQELVEEDLELPPPKVPGPEQPVLVPLYIELGLAANLEKKKIKRQGTQTVVYGGLYDQLPWSTTKPRETVGSALMPMDVERRKSELHVTQAQLENGVLFYSQSSKPSVYTLAASPALAWKELCHCTDEDLFLIDRDSYPALRALAMLDRLDGCSHPGHILLQGRTKEWADLVYDLFDKITLEKWISIGSKMAQVLEDEVQTANHIAEGLASCGFPTMREIMADLCGGPPPLGLLTGQQRFMLVTPKIAQQFLLHRCSESEEFKIPSRAPWLGPSTLCAGWKQRQRLGDCTCNSSFSLSHAYGLQLLDRAFCLATGTRTSSHVAGLSGKLLITAKRVACMRKREYPVAKVNGMIYTVRRTQSGEVQLIGRSPYGTQKCLYASGQLSTGGWHSTASPIPFPYCPAAVLGHVFAALCALVLLVVARPAIVWPEPEGNRTLSSGSQAVAACGLMGTWVSLPPSSMISTAGKEWDRVFYSGCLMAHSCSCPLRVPLFSGVSLISLSRQLFIPMIGLAVTLNVMHR
eukprot:scpid50912/ scgid2713/ 